jgi:hypothetical protein
VASKLIPSVASGSRKIERGSLLYLNAQERRQWERVYAIAHEGDRSEEEARELLERAMQLALEQEGRLQ